MDRVGGPRTPGGIGAGCYSREDSRRKRRPSGGRRDKRPSRMPQAGRSRPDAMVGPCPGRSGNGQVRFTGKDGGGGFVRCPLDCQRLRFGGQAFPVLQRQGQQGIRLHVRQVPLVQLAQDRVQALPEDFDPLRLADGVLLEERVQA